MLYIWVMNDTMKQRQQIPMKKQNTKADLYAEIAVLKNAAKSALELLTRIQRDAPDSAGAKYPHLAGAYEYGVEAAIASLQRMVDR